MSPLDHRKELSNRIADYRANWHTPNCNLCARRVVELFEAHRWLGDQIPNDILEMAYRDDALLTTKANS